MIQLREIYKRYSGAAKGEFALRGADLEIEEGELVAIIGTSGSGKTTLLNIIGGLDRDFQGEAEVFGRKLQTLSDRELSSFRNREVGFIFQHFSLLDHLTTLENVALPAYFLKGPSPIPNPRARALESLEMLGIGHKAGERPSNLSGGQKQRVAIARSLLFKPRLLLCDEPTGSLDSTTGRQIIETFQSLNKEGYTVLMITHETRVSDAAQRVIRIEDGQITDDGRSS